MFSNNPKFFIKTPSKSLFWVPEGGFTLVETIVATGIIVISLVSSLALINVSLAAISSFQDRLVAANLAAEGLEIIIGIRDDNWLNSRSWNSGLADGDYEVTYNSISPYVDSFMTLNPITGLYGYTIGDDSTIFKRRIAVTNLSSYEMRVVSTVTGTRKGGAYSSSAELHLFDWK